MSEEIKPGDNGHGAEGQEQPPTPEVKVRQLLVIGVTDTGKVLVKGPMADEQVLCLTALGEAVKIVSNFEKPVIMKPDFRSSLRRFLPNKRN